MVRGAAKGRSSWVCQGTLNGIPNAESYVLELSFVRNHLIHTLTPPPHFPLAISIISKRGGNDDSMKLRVFQLRTGTHKNW